jgi:Domain of unknown function (DUF5753)
MARFEAGSNLPNQSNIEVLLNFYGQPDKFPMMAELLAVARLKTPQAGNTPASTVDDFELFLGFEAFAKGIEVFDPRVVTGLLQTEAYARELITYHASITPGVHIEQSLAVRRERQAVITRADNPAELWVVMEEQALRRPVGSPAVMAEQLDHLLAATERPNVTVQVVPQNVGVHPALTGAFSLLRFEDDWRVTYEEARRSAYYHDSAEAVEDYDRVMNHLRHLTLTPQRSRALMIELRKEVQSSP